MITAKNKGAVTQRAPGRRPRASEEDENEDDALMNDDSPSGSQTELSTGQTQNNQ
jgi:hypothetical protein